MNSILLLGLFATTEVPARAEQLIVLPACHVLFPVTGNKDNYIFIVNRSLYLDNISGIRSVRLDEGEILRTFEGDPVNVGSGRIQEYRLDALSSSTGDIDVITQFIYLQSQIRVYWRESYVNRSYRFGIADIGPHSLTPRCEDWAGVEIDH